MRQMLRIRDVRVFLVGWTISQFGDWAMIIVLAVWAKALTDSNAAAGLVFFAFAAPSLFSPLAGVVVDGPVVDEFEAEVEGVRVVVVARFALSTFPGNDFGSEKLPTSIPSVIPSMYLFQIVAGNVGDGTGGATPSSIRTRRGI